MKNNLGNTNVLSEHSSKTIKPTSTKFAIPMLHNNSLGDSNLSTANSKSTGLETKDYLLGVGIILAPIVTAGIAGYSIIKIIHAITD